MDFNLVHSDKEPETQTLPAKKEDTPEPVSVPAKVSGTTVIIVVTVIIIVIIGLIIFYVSRKKKNES